LTEHDDVTAGAPRLGLALDPATAGAGTGYMLRKFVAAWPLSSLATPMFAVK